MIKNIKNTRYYKYQKSYACLQLFQKNLSQTIKDFFQSLNALHFYYYWFLIDKYLNIIYELILNDVF